MSENNNREYVNINSQSTTSRSSKKKKSGMFVARIVSGILAGVLLLTGSAFVGVGAWYNKNATIYESVSKPSTDTDTDNDNDNIDTTEAELDSIELSLGDGGLLSDPYVLNIMLFGTDRYGDAGLSDTMILLSIDNRHQKIKMTSFLRDTYVAIPGVGYHKLNYSYAVGGAGLAIQTIEQNYGVQIDRYATVNFSTFQEIVDIMGGVEIEVTANEIGYINAQIMENGQSDYITESAGVITLSGQQALWYARNRGGTYGGVTYSGDDWARTDRQRKFLNAVIEQMKDASLTEIVEIVNEVGPNVTTDLKKTEITMLLADALTYLNYEVEQCSMPASGVWSYGWNEAGSVILVNDWYQARLDLASFVYEESVVS